MSVEELREERKRKKITMKELSLRSGIPIRTLEDVFSGRTPHPRIDTMQAIEKALGLADGSPLDNARVNMLTDKETRLLMAFNSLIPPMQDYILEMVEKLVKQPQNAKG